MRSRDFFLGYSPERVNPGDREHTIERVLKVVAGENCDVTARLSAIYGAVTSGGIYEAPSIQVAEAAKVIENAQRDLNIAFMNEIAQIFSSLDISIWDVLKTARTKWNFLPFEPGLVGGHCIGVDPYYLAHRAAEVGHDPAIILAARTINDGMGAWVAKQVSALLAPGAAMLVLGLTFKEDLPDLRNSKVVAVIAQLRTLGHHVDVSDPLASAAQAKHHYGLTMTTAPADGAYDAVLVAVSHTEYRVAGVEGAVRYLSAGGLLADLRGLFAPADIPEGVRYWRL
ncbi:MAG: nucleotide sugar dehydrogenase [Sphingomonas sp.]